MFIVWLESVLVGAVPPPSCTRNSYPSFDRESVAPARSAHGGGGSAENVRSPTGSVIVADVGPGVAGAVVSDTAVVDELSDDACVVDPGATLEVVVAEETAG